MQNPTHKHSSLRRQRERHISHIDVCATNARAREGTVTAHGPRSTHATFPSSLRNIDRLTRGYGIQCEFGIAKGPGRRRRVATALLDCARNATTYSEERNINVVVDELGRFARADCASNGVWVDCFVRPNPESWECEGCREQRQEEED